MSKGQEATTVPPTAGTGDTAGDAAASCRSGRIAWFVVELLASITTLAGIYVGSTTAVGAGLYLLSLAFWWAMTIGKRMWGLVPLNTATMVVAYINLWTALR